MLPATRALHSESIFFCIRAALCVRDEIVNAASILARSHGLPGHIFDPSLLHFSLCGIGRPKQQRESFPVIVKRVGDAVQFSQFEATLDAALGFKQASGGFPNVLMPDEYSTRMLSLLNQALRKAQLFNGLIVPKSFTPHLTLTRSSIIGHTVGQSRRFGGLLQNLNSFTATTTEKERTMFWSDFRC